MKKLVLMTMLLSAAGAQAKFGNAPELMPVKCKVGGQTIHAQLKTCAHKTAQIAVGRFVNGQIVRGDHCEDSPSREVGRYWCEDKITDDLSVRVTGWMGTGGSVIRISYLPGGFSGLTPVEVNGKTVNCELDYPNSNPEELSCY
jgi:hypothetical protein